MKKKPDNVVYNHTTNEYDAFKKNYPTNFSSKKFDLEKIENLRIEAKPFFKSKFNELKKNYEELVNKLKWNEIIFNAKYSFNPIMGKKYYLYKGKENNFLSIIKPNEWKKNHIGTFRLDSNKTWEKV